MKNKLEELKDLRDQLLKICQVDDKLKIYMCDIVNIISRIIYEIKPYYSDKINLNVLYGKLAKSPVKYSPELTKKETTFLMNQHSYLTKNKFMELINNLDFIAIENTRIHFITDFVNQIKINDPKDSLKDEYITKTRGFDLELY